MMAEGPLSIVPNNSGDVFPRMIPAIIPTVVPTTIVREVLTESNYENWRTCVQWYLVGQDLWDVCRNKGIPDKERHPEEFSVWEKKNAMALHAIQISCSGEMLARIRGETCASYVWDFLERNAKPTFHFEAKVTGNADFSQCKDLIKALDRGSWKDIESLLENLDVRAKISPTGETALHIAASAGHVKVVQNLVQDLNPEDLIHKEDIGGHTPLALAAWYGFKEIAECMIRKNPGLTSILDKDGFLPVVLACNQGKNEMTRYLYSHTPLAELARDEGKNGATLLSYCIGSKFLDIALEIHEYNPSLAVALDVDGLFPLYALGQTPSLFKSGSRLWFWQRWICSRIKNIHDQKIRHDQAIKLLRSICTKLKAMKVNEAIGFRVHQAVIQAIKQGNVEFVTEMIISFPELAWDHDINGRNIFSIAILYRQEKIFNLLHGLPNVKKMKLTSAKDRFGNNMLHLVAKLAPSDKLDGIAGAALQMQRELQWFKEVESIVPPIFKDLVNSDGKKPSEVFSQQHAHLVKEGEKWMKEIATSSSVVAALIVTIMFAAAFTIPGGNNDKGTPIFLEDNLFMVFIISDSISLFSATTSVLMFLGILTSQYAEIKFLKRLPTKLMIGLSTLFISTAAMMITFCAALAILLKESSTKVVLVVIMLLACVPVTLFALLQFPLLVNISISTYWPGIFNRKIRHWC